MQLILHMHVEGEGFAYDIIICRAPLVARQRICKRLMGPVKEGKKREKKFFEIFF